MPSCREQELDCVKSTSLCARPCRKRHCPSLSSFARTMSHVIRTSLHVFKRFRTHSAVRFFTGPPLTRGQRPACALGRYQLWPKRSLATLFYQVWPNHLWPTPTLAKPSWSRPHLAKPDLAILFLTAFGQTEFGHDRIWPT